MTINLAFLNYLPHFIQYLIDNNGVSLFCSRYTRDRQQNKRSPDNTVWDTMARIAKEGPERHLYAFVTSYKGGVGGGGWAPIGSLCNTGRDQRVNINRYNRAAPTAGVLNLF